LVPLTVQTAGVVEENTTALPDAPPVALTVPIPLTTNAGGEPKTMLCTAAVMETLCVTCGAMAYVASPDWSAAMTHVPAATTVTNVPAMVQTAVVVETKFTGRPELAVAFTVKVAVKEYTIGPGLVPKVIV
jgi:hypothetical protein